MPGWLVAISNSGRNFAFFRRMLLRLCSPGDLAFGIRDYHLDPDCLRFTVLTALRTGAASDYAEQGATDTYHRITHR